MNLQREKDESYADYRQRQLAEHKQQRHYEKGQLVYAHPLPFKDDAGEWIQPKRKPYTK